MAQMWLLKSYAAVKTDSYIADMGLAMMNEKFR